MFIAIAAALSVSAAQTEQQNPPVGDALAALLACRAIAEDSSRLVCLDRETAALARSREGGEVIIIDRAEAEATRRRLFGFQLPSVAGLFSETEVERLDQIEGTLARARQGGDGRWVFTLEDGAVWRQVDGDPVRFTNRAGQSVMIRRASLGSYQLLTGGSRAVRVRRQ